ncbi:MAG: ABC transporter ATP-binding protein [bacterium]|nr:ABC transporter ATP-binding protein [bacterium]
MSADPAVRLQGLHRRFGEVRAVNGVDLEVPRGCTFGLLGPNGAGKTTTLKLLLGLLRPDSGTVELLGQPVSGASLPGLLARVGYVSEGRDLYDYLRVGELLALNARLYPSWDGDAVRRYLEIFNLPAGRRVDELSQGMKSQLALVLALGQRPELLVLDEPTGGLDPVMRREFLALVADEVAGGRTCVLSSHILHEVERVADLVAIMQHGRILAVRSMEAIRSNEKRIRFVPQHEVKEEDLRLAGVAAVERQGKGFVLSVSADLDAVIRRLAAVPHFVLEVIDLNLEDVFFDYVDKESGRRG